MCGIIGAYNFSGRTVDRSSLQRANNQLRHRGPDGEGFLLLNTLSGEHALRNGPDTPSNIHYPFMSEDIGFQPNLIFGHRRLAILDLSPAGHEPMTVQGEKLWITFNGEIYNFLELRDE